MSSEEARKKLVQFLDERVFEPIMKAPEKGLTESQRGALRHIKRSTEAERVRYFEDYRTAEYVRHNYLSDLSSSSGKRISSELKQLGLPSLPDVKEEFLELCEKLGVGPRATE